MATNSAAKKFLIGLSVFLLLLAAVGAWFGTSLQRKHLGDLRSSPLDGIGPEWLQNYTIGDPDVHIDDIVIVDHLAHYVEPLVAEQPSFNAQKNILSALNSNFRGRLQVGDLLEFRSPDFPDEHQHATVKELIDNNNVLLAAGSGIQIRGTESIRLMRLFTGQPIDSMSRHGINLNWMQLLKVSKHRQDITTITTDTCMRGRPP